jgi:hypothetical protein
MLIEELKYFQSLLESPAEKQPTLSLENNLLLPTFPPLFADGTIIGLRHTQIPANRPQLKQETSADLERFWQ